MALITCLECGKEISDKASVCVHCGCPIELLVDTNNKKIVYTYMCMSDKCLSNPFKEFYEKNGTKKCPDCGARLEYYETETIDSNTERVVDRHVDKNIKKEGNDISTPKCPTCGSSNMSKVGAVSRAVSIGLFGLASGKIGKTHKCGNCGSMW